MDNVVLLVLLLIIIAQAVLLYFIIEKHGDEKKVLLTHIKDVTDKLYFTRSQDFVTNKIITENPEEKKEPEKPEEQGVPLENVPIEELAKAYGVEVKTNG